MYLSSLHLQSATLNTLKNNLGLIINSEGHAHLTFYVYLTANYRKQHNIHP